MNQSLLLDVETYTCKYIEEKLPKEYVYHNLGHTREVAEACMELAVSAQLSREKKELLLIAAWFHDVGYVDGPEEHEERSAALAEQYLKKKEMSSEKIDIIKSAILATKMPQNPEGELDKILCDADVSHLGKSTYWDRCRRVRQEYMVIKEVIFTEEEWLNFEIDFMQNHNYHTAIADDLYGKRKNKHIKQLKKLRSQLFPKLSDEIGKRKKKNKKNKVEKTAIKNQLEIKEMRLGRGVETMYRTTYRTHVNLSSIADNKANIMLSINAIVISIILSTLVPRFSDDPRLVIPTFILLVVCLVAVVFATLSTRPKITEGRFTREDIEEKRSNLLFFGNFYNMKLDDFHWGMMEMIKDSDFLYSSMTRDLYYLGVVLAKKYQYLRICYGVFMYGLILSVLAFAITFLIS